MVLWKLLWEVLQITEMKLQKIYFRWLATKETLGQAWRQSAVVLMFKTEAGRPQVQRQHEHDDTPSHKVENIKKNSVNFIDLYPVYLYIVINLGICVSCEYLVQQKLTLCKCKSSTCCVTQLFTNTGNYRHFVCREWHYPLDVTYWSVYLKRSKDARFPPLWIRLNWCFNV